MTTSKKMARKKLPSRRPCENIDFEHEGHRFTASIGRGREGEVTEVFCHGQKTGTALNAMMQDACILVSRAIQFGDAPDEIRKGMKRNSRNEPSSPIGRLLDIVAGGINATK